jgi:plastocyanin
MKRGMLLCIVVGAMTAVLGMPVAALAGGGCHGGATQADESGQREATIRIVDACFTASVTKVDPGTPVTFVSTDQGLTHNVIGSEWGQFEDMTKGDAFTATFADPGIYPFACSYHPGMIGAIVVGNGTGVGSGWTVSVDPFEPTTKTVPTVATAADGRIPAGAVIAIGVAGLVLGAGLALGLSRRAKVPSAG